MEDGLLWTGRGGSGCLILPLPLEEPSGDWTVSLSFWGAILLGLMGLWGLKSLLISSPHASSMRDTLRGGWSGVAPRREGRLRGMSGISAPPSSSISTPCCWPLVR